MLSQLKNNSKTDSQTDNDKLNQTITTQDTDQTDTLIINDNKTTSNKTTISINTDYSKLTDDILIKHTNHSQKQFLKRNIEDSMIKKCLKYGRKEKQGSKVVFTFGNLKVIKAGPNQSTGIITLYKIFDDQVGAIREGTVMKYWKNKKYGWIETEKGSVFFQLEEHTENM